MRRFACGAPVSIATVQGGSLSLFASIAANSGISALCSFQLIIDCPSDSSAARLHADPWIQQPEGAWGWRAYPEGTTGPYGNRAINDGVTTQVMSNLHVIWCATGDDKYLHPILKGAEWVVKAQSGPPTYGWADQFDKDFNMIWNRATEPPAVSS